MDGINANHCAMTVPRGTRSESFYEAPGLYELAVVYVKLSAKRRARRVVCRAFSGDPDESNPEEGI
jgi:hypothetical protein